MGAPLQASGVFITCHSSDSRDRPYTDYASEFGYYEWIHYAGAEDSALL